ncbi:MAG: toxin-antitoxin system toxin subunit [Dermatophilaceae bacterium]
MRLGFDTSAGLLETVVLVFLSGDEMVFRAMPVGKKYLDLLP